MNKFREALKEGEDGERMVAEWLMGRGWHVAPVYQYGEHSRAPALYSAAGSTTLPDLAAYRDGDALFVEVKRKTRWTRRPSTGERETGCNLRLWDHYRSIADKTGIAVWLVFVHDRGQPPLGVWTVNAASAEPRRWDGRHDRTGRRISPPLALFAESDLAFVAEALTLP